MTPRYLELLLPTIGARGVARLLDEDAPRTCDAVWAALPLEDELYHAKYARNEVYAFFSALADPPIGLENPTITPIPGDLCYFEFSSGQLPAGSYGYAEDQGSAGRDMVVDLALFYGRNNLLINGDVGFVPGNVFATVVEGLDELAAACNRVWREGAVGERLLLRKHEG